MTTDFIKNLKQERVARMEGPGRATLEKYVSQGDGILLVDWEKLVNDKHNFYKHASDGVSCDFWNDVLDYLRTKEVLTYQLGRAFHVIVNGQDACPIDEVIIHYHFARKEDAEKYNHAEFARTRRMGEIFQFV